MALRKFSVATLPDGSSAGLVRTAKSILAMPCSFARVTVADVEAAWRDDRRSFRPWAEVHGEVSARVARLARYEQIKAGLLASGFGGHAECCCEAERLLGVVSANAS